ncbi:MAG: hypothetical protein B6I36_10335 [Desulfobacteraceae bacterium 4572_35.1]|nr:MAG: hypothetical protein B6I36_10335 [Desulfobacteraceae bacterium 4572_35.1]
MAKQFIAFIEHDVRDTVTGSETNMFIPVMGSLQPTFEPTDESRQEFRGGDTALGDTTVVRRSSQWSFSLECAWYPGVEVGTLLKHALGHAGTRAVEDTSAFKGIVYPAADPFSAAELGDKALGFYVNTDEGGTTRSRLYFGGRVKSVAINGEGTDDIKLTFEIVGPGEFINAEAAETAGASFTTVSPFCSADLTCFVGTGASRVGTAPNYTSIAEGTMDSFCPDSINMTITNGMDDKQVMCGVKGPGKTYRSGQFSVELTAPIDYEDPASGFSSADEVKQIFDDPIQSSLMLKLDNGEDAGATVNYTAVIDLPSVMLNPGTPQRNSDGSQPTVELSYKSLYSTTTEYPVAILTVDKASAY